ncbi:uncharacterized protein LOC128559644 [Mercenaria mercenaria]|uniref:uncharacterized protein LOC128559644 n=1 Tax=Mercenaria mercenaria TaxID=6596 RepID=UPI00234E698E|nr:uncharacterized protein LOC128559644 [Mercenaria mercenaria]
MVHKNIDIQIEQKENGDNLMSDQSHTLVMIKDGTVRRSFQNTKKSSSLKEPRAVEYSPRSEASKDVKKGFTNQGKTTGGSSKKTTVRYVENQEDTNSKTVEKTIELPSSKSFTIVQHYIAGTLQRLQDQGFSVSLTDNKVCIKGKVEDIEDGIQELTSAVKAVDSLYDETLAFSSSTKLTDVRKEVNQIEEYMDVCFIINEKKKTVTVHGKNIKDVSEAKHELEKCLIGTLQNSHTSQNSGNIKQQKNIETDMTIREPTKAKQRIERSFSWLPDSENCKMFLTKQNIKIKVYSANILVLPVDCIVNAANINLAHGGGVARAIAKAAGKDLTKEGYDYLKSHGKLKVGEACYTKAGQLPYKLVIHAVGPCWSDYTPHSQAMVDRCELDLYNAVINSLSLAERCDMQTIAIPAISSGIYGCPADVCCVQYGRAVLHYSQLSKCPLKEIHFVDINKDIVCDIKQTFEVMIRDENLPSTYNKAKYIKKQTGRDKKNSKDASDKLQSPRNNFMKSDGKPATQSMHSADRNRSLQQSTSPATLRAGYLYESGEQPPGHHKKSYTYTVGQGQKIYIYSGNLLTLRTIDMIACGEVPKGVGQGKVTQKLLELGGERYKSQKKSAFTSAVKPGDIVFCKGGASNFQWVAHAVLNPWSNPGKVEDIWQAVSNIYEDIFYGMMKRGCHSLALPLIGTGKGNADPKSCARNLFESLVMFCSKNKSYKFDIHLVHMESDKTKMAIGVLKGMVQNLVTDANPTSSFPNSQRRTNDTRSTRGKPQGRPASASFHQASKPKMPVNGSSSCDSRRPSRGNRTPNTQKGFDSRKSRIQGPPRHTEYDKSCYTSGQQRFGDKSHSKDEDLYHFPQEEEEEDFPQEEDFHQEEDAVSNDSDSSADGKESGENVTGNLKIVEVSNTDSQKDNFGTHKTEFAMSEEMRKKDESSHDVSDEESDKDDNNQEEDAETCVICMEDITDPQKLSCGHVFCADCIKEQFTYKQACPTCGKVCGIIKGDQPYGQMDVVINDRASCAGFESSGRIEITYKFPDGTQEDNHPCPGQRYKGITRTAYLPNNRKGREICDMLKVAFKRKLVFTIGRSRTTGADGVITWNDIHHKTDPKPHSQFGYPDPTYLDRVTEELEVKGVTVKDIPTDHAARPRRR